MDTSPWKINFYETSREERPVYEFFIKQQAKARSKITQLTDLLAQYGNMLGLPYSKALGGGLYELRIRGTEEIRILYCFIQQKTICLLHAFKKQTQQTPRKELDLGIRRMGEVKGS